MSDLKLVVQLRQQTGAGMVDCQKALDEAAGDLNKAVEILRKKGEAKAAKRSETREAKEGIVYAYIHGEGKVGAMLELNCETDFVARTEDFKALAHDIALQIAALSAQYLSPADVPTEIVAKEKEIYRELLLKEGKPEAMLEKIMEGKLSKFYEEVCLLNQKFIKDDKMTITDLVTQAGAKTGEKIKISRFSRFEV